MAEVTVGKAVECALVALDPLQRLQRPVDIDVYGGAGVTPCSECETLVVRCSLRETSWASRLARESLITRIAGSSATIRADAGSALIEFMGSLNPTTGTSHAPKVSSR